jgi:hypothetical protein
MGLSPQPKYPGIKACNFGPSPAIKEPKPAGFNQSSGKRESKYSEPVPLDVGLGRPWSKVKTQKWDPFRTPASPVLTKDDQCIEAGGPVKGEPRVVVEGLQRSSAGYATAAWRHGGPRPQVPGFIINSLRPCSYSNL